MDLVTFSAFSADNRLHKLAIHTFLPYADRGLRHAELTHEALIHAAVDTFSRGKGVDDHHSHPLPSQLDGGGTDFPAFFRERGGLAISAALNKYFYVSMTRRFDDGIRLSYSRTETVRTSRDLEHDIARTILARYNLHSGLENRNDW